MPKKSSAKTSTKTTNTKCCPTCQSQLPFYAFIAILVALLTIMLMTVGLGNAVHDIEQKNANIYSGRFDKENGEGQKDENGITVISAAAVNDMVRGNKTGFLIVSEENCIGCDAFARRVAAYASDDLSDIFRYNRAQESGVDDNRAKSLLSIGDSTPDFLYIKDGVVFDRIDDVKNFEDLQAFLIKYDHPVRTEAE